MWKSCPKTGVKFSIFISLKVPKKVMNMLIIANGTIKQAVRWMPLNPIKFAEVIPIRKKSRMYILEKLVK